MDLPSTIGWRKRDEDGMIVTWDLPNGAEVAHALSPELASGMDAVELRWGELCAELADEFGVPNGWPQAHVWRESNGNPFAFRQERHKDGTPIVTHGRPLTGVGLMQITDPGLKGSHTDKDLFDPRLNLTIGVKYLAFLRGKYGDDFPRVSAAYNAGSVQSSTANPWGMVMTTGHVSAEVAAYNHWLAANMASEQRAAALALTKQFTLFDLVPARPAVDTIPDSEDV